ncbi:MAG: hypothetical protein QW734_08630 [Candidatus Bathyarchaeia archaeon]
MKRESGAFPPPFPTTPILVDENRISLPGADWEDGKWRPSDRLAWLIERMKARHPQKLSRWAFFPDPSGNGGVVAVEPPDEEMSVFWVLPDGSVRHQKTLKISSDLVLRAMTPDGWLAVGDWWISPDGGTVVQDDLLGIPESTVSSGHSILLRDGLVITPAGPGEERRVSRLRWKRTPQFWDGNVAICYDAYQLAVWAGDQERLSVPRVQHHLILPDGFWIVSTPDGVSYGHRDRFWDWVSPNDLVEFELWGRPEFCLLSANRHRINLGIGWVVLLTIIDPHLPRLHPLILLIDERGKIGKKIEGVCPATEWVDIDPDLRLLIFQGFFPHCATLIRRSSDSEGAPAHIVGELTNRWCWGENGCVLVFEHKPDVYLVFPRHNVSWKTKPNLYARNPQGVLLLREGAAGNELVFVPEGDPEKATNIPFEPLSRTSIFRIYERQGRIYVETATKRYVLDGHQLR